MQHSRIGVIIVKMIDGKTSRRAGVIATTTFVRQIVSSMRFLHVSRQSAWATAMILCVWNEKIDLIKQ